MPPAILKVISLEGGDTIVIRDWAGQSQTFCNLQRLDASGAEVWTAIPRHPLQGVWTDVSIKDGRLNAYNWSGFEDVIDPDSGRIVSSTFVR